MGRRDRLVVERIKLNLHLTSGVYLESLLHVVTFTLNTPTSLSDVLILDTPIPAILLSKIPNLQSYLELLVFVA